MENYFIKLTLLGLLGLNLVPVEASSNYMNQLEYQLSYFKFNASVGFGRQDDYGEICKDHSPKVYSNSDGLVYKYDRVPPRKGGKPWRDGFNVEGCYSLTDNVEDEEFCFFLNPHINQGDGLVIFTRPSVMNQSLDNQFSLIHDTSTASAVELVQMSDKGGIGSRASRHIMAGERVTQARAVAIVSVEDAVIQSPHANLLRKMAVDLLPLHSRRGVALMIGDGETEEEWISNAYNMNCFSANLGDDTILHFALISGEPTRLNHACRANVGFYFDSATLEVIMHAFRPIAPGEELTIAYHRMDKPRNERLEDLKNNYKFDCGCSHCSMSPEEALESDQRIRRMKKLRDGVMNNKIPFTPKVEEELIVIYEKENLLGTAWDLYYTLAVGYRSLGDLDKVVYYLKKAIQWSQLIVEPRGRFVVALHQLAENPELMRGN